jgi:hypothetical protein
MIRINIAYYFIAFALTTNIVYAKLNNPHEANIFKTECIGQYQLSFPSNVEVAMNKPAYDGFTDYSSFNDDQVAPFSNMQYFGYLNVISPAKEADFIYLKKILLQNRDKVKQSLLDSDTADSKYLVKLIKPLTYDTMEMFGWDGSDYVPGIYYFSENKIIAHILTNYDDESHRVINNIHFEAFLKGFRIRHLYELPNQQGICIPYGFIADDGSTPHTIAVTMRLRDYPDVEVGFQDNSEGEPVYESGKNIQYIHPEPKDAINSFFNNSGVTNNLEKVESNFPGYHSIQMDGQKGGAVFFTVIREDKSKDYGYIAAVKGDDKAGVPSQLLYVIRTASRAKGKPVSKDELKDMAEKIMASVKRHPVQ